MESMQKHFLFSVLILALVILIGGFFAAGNPLVWSNGVRGVTTVLFAIGTVASFFRHL